MMKIHHQKRRPAELQQHNDHSDQSHDVYNSLEHVQANNNFA